MSNAKPNQTIELLSADLNREGGVYCPSPNAHMQVWNTHPKVFLNIAHTGSAKCPYCGTVYALRAGEQVAAGH